MHARYNSEAAELAQAFDLTNSPLLRATIIAKLTGGALEEALSRVEEEQRHGTTLALVTVNKELDAAKQKLAGLRKMIDHESTICLRVRETYISLADELSASLNGVSRSDRRDVIEKVLNRFLADTERKLDDARAQESTNVDLSKVP